MKNRNDSVQKNAQFNACNKTAIILYNILKANIYFFILTVTNTKNYFHNVVCNTR